MAGISSKLPPITTKVKIIVGVVVVFFVALAVMGVTMLLMQASNDSVQEDFSKMDAKTRQVDAAELARQAFESGNTKKLENVYKKAIEAEPDTAKKVELAIDYSRILKGTDRMADALEVATKAETYQEDKHKISVWLASLYQADKQYDKAAEYYRTAADTVDSPSNKGFSKAFYEDKAEKMKQLAAKK